MNSYSRQTPNVGAHGHPHGHGHHPQAPLQPPQLLDFEPATYHSTFGPLYTQRIQDPYADEDGDLQMPDMAEDLSFDVTSSSTSSALVVSNGGAYMYQSTQSQPQTQTHLQVPQQTAYLLHPATPLPDPHFSDQPDMYLFAHYMQHVLPAMYLLADRSIDIFIRRLADGSNVVRNAVCFVASAHWESKRLGGVSRRGRGSLLASPSSEVSSLDTPPVRGHPPLPSALDLDSSNTYVPTATSIPNPSSTRSTYHAETLRALKQVKEAGSLREGDALASLMSVSSFLFAGGRGGWEWFLGVACEYVDGLLRGGVNSNNGTTSVGGETFGPFVLQYNGLSYPLTMPFDLSNSPTSPTASARPCYAEILRRSSDTVRFVVRATMWFEVLASVTEVRRPRFMDVYRELFGSARFSVVDDLNTSTSAGGSSSTNSNNNGHESSSGSETSTPETEDTTAGGLSMLSIMGCDNRTFLAIAEISEFAAWKEDELRKGRLSVPELVMRGKQLEEQFFGGEKGRASRGEDKEEEATTSGSGGGDTSTTPKLRRAYTARIFRAAAKLYLQTVISDDQPMCSEIEEGVQEVIRALKRVPSLRTPPPPYSSSSNSNSNSSGSNSESESRRHAEAGSIIRSVVFPICIAGSMTDIKEEQEYLSALLESQSEAGNCAEVLKAMNTVWTRRRDARRKSRGRESGRAPEVVGWRDVVQQNGILLLV